MTDLRSIHYNEIAETLTGKRKTVHQFMAGLANPVTAVELAELMGWDKCSVRPRLCELSRVGLVRPTGERRNGEHVWRYVSAEKAQQTRNDSSQELLAI